MRVNSFGTSEAKNRRRNERGVRKSAERGALTAGEGSSARSVIKEGSPNMGINVREVRACGGRGKRSRRSPARSKFECARGLLARTRQIYSARLMRARGYKFQGTLLIDARARVEEQRGARRLAASFGRVRGFTRAAAVGGSSWSRRLLRFSRNFMRRPWEIRIARLLQPRPCM